MNLAKLQATKSICIDFVEINDFVEIKKSLAFLYTNNQKSEREIKESTPFTTATK